MDAPKKTGEIQKPLISRLADYFQFGKTLRGGMGDTALTAGGFGMVGLSLAAKMPGVKEVVPPGSEGLMFAGGLGAIGIGLAFSLSGQDEKLAARKGRK